MAKVLDEQALLADIKGEGGDPAFIEWAKKNLLWPLPEETNEKRIQDIIDCADALAEALRKTLRIGDRDRFIGTLREIKSGCRNRLLIQEKFYGDSQARALAPANFYLWMGLLVPY